MGLDAGKAFAFLDKFEVALDGLQGWLDNTFENISMYGQEGVDAVCAWTGEWASYKIAQIEEKIVKGLHGPYMGATDALGIGAPIYNLVTGGISADPTALATGLLKVAMPWVPPTLDAIQTLVQVPLKLLSIASKLSILASYRPPVTAPGINFSNFNINVRPPSMGDIISGTFDLPEVPKPFTHYMKVCIAGAREKVRLDKERLIAEINEAEQKALEEKQAKAQEKKNKAKSKKLSIKTAKNTVKDVKNAGKFFS